MAVPTAIGQAALDGTTILTGTVLVFVVSVLVGGVGNYVGIRVVSDQHPSFVHAVVSTVISAAVWALVSYGLQVSEASVTPFAGALVALLVWILVLYVRYDGGIVTAVPAGVASWLVAVATLYLLALVTTVPFEAFGIPAV
ncbi:hypothetical protein [Halomarina oriensis]|uniref:Uncharacterized protein n=1 Tax=Halomarina oriensis TaxID=671145 RepID=A0A6B0GLA5_9EURY|nr:hypothetical protein [Halomarina oriensis]MWG34497.1 hypothetical protein [Halomarina oriensis]